MLSERNGDRYVDWRKLDWHDWRDWNTYSSGTKKVKGTHRLSHVEPICGWSWIQERQHIIPECHLEVNYGGVRHSMTILAPSVIKNVVTAMKTKPHPFKAKPLWHKNKCGGVAVPLPPK